MAGLVAFIIGSGQTKFSAEQYPRGPDDSKGGCLSYVCLALQGLGVQDSREARGKAESLGLVISEWRLRNGKTRIGRDSGFWAGRGGEGESGRGEWGSANGPLELQGAQ